MILLSFNVPSYLVFTCASHLFSIFFQIFLSSFSSPSPSFVYVGSSYTEPVPLRFNSIVSANSCFKKNPPLPLKPPPLPQNTRLLISQLHTIIRAYPGTRVHPHTPTHAHTGAHPHSHTLCIRWVLCVHHPHLALRQTTQLYIILQMNVKAHDYSSYNWCRLVTDHQRVFFQIFLHQIQMLNCQTEVPFRLMTVKVCLVCHTYIVERKGHTCNYIRWWRQTHQGKAMNTDHNLMFYHSVVWNKCTL